MSARPLSSTLRPLGRCRGPSSRLAACPRRRFGSTPALAVSVIFAETENERLNAVLKEIQDKIILPARLPKKQRDIVFNPRKRIYLEQNPIVIDVEDYEHKFSTIDRFRDVENSKKLLAKAIDAMQAPADWANLATLLAGYKKAHIKIKDDHWGKMVRVAGETGNIQAIIECAKQSDETGFTLGKLEAAVRTLVYINNQTVEHYTSMGPKTLKSAEGVFELLLRPEHGNGAKKPINSLVFSRLVRSLILFARCAAVFPKRRPSDEDLVSIRDEAVLVSRLWNRTQLDDVGQLPELMKLSPTVDKASERRVRRGLNGFCYVQAMAQSIKGLMLAEQYLPDLADGLVRAREAVEDHARHFWETAPGHCQAWADEYDRVTKILTRADEEAPEATSAEKQASAGATPEASSVEATPAEEALAEEPVSGATTLADEGLSTDDVVSNEAVMESETVSEDAPRVTGEKETKTDV